MFRFSMALALVALCAVQSQAALLASFNFNTDLSPSFQSSQLTSVTGLTPVSGRLVWQAATGVGGTGAGRFTNTASQALPPTTNAATLTLNRTGKLKVDSVSFDLARNVSGTTPELRITNNVTSDVFIVAPTTATGTFAPYSFSLSAHDWTSSITFTFSRRVTAGSAGGLLIDNLNIDGQVPEPASMATFAGLGIAAFAIRRRNRKA